MNEWKPRDEIVSAAHRWYWIAACFLLGALLGWLVSFIWPAPYRATRDLYVGLNANRATRDLYIAEVAQESFENLDDYKHWQMSQLNALVLSDEYLDETLKRLQADDSKWQSLDVSGLREVLSVAWRNTGEWHFSALMNESDFSVQAVTVWSEVVLEKTNDSIAAARQLIFIDSNLNAVSQSLDSAEARQILLLETQHSLDDWVESLEGASADQTLSPLEHWKLLAQVAVVSDWRLEWLAVLDAAPSLASFPKVYLDWLVQANALIGAELEILPPLIKDLDAEQTSLISEYNIAAEQSRALSANLEVSQIKDELPNIVHLRSVGTLMLIGGLLGLLAWMTGWLVQITRKSER